MRTTLILFFSLLFCNCYSQTDTTINGKHYNTVLYYPYFDYKCNDTLKNHYVVGIGNMVDSVKSGTWTYYFGDGLLLAKGKYKEGYKSGKWIYMSVPGEPVELIWEQSAKGKDFIKYNSENERAEIIDVVNTEEVKSKYINGHKERDKLGCWRFL